MNKIKYITVVTGIIASITIGCTRENKEKVQVEDKTEKVEVQTLAKEEITRELEFSATLQGYEEMKISPSLSGKIEHIFTDVGTRVSKGQLLIRMDQNQLNSAKIQLQNVQVEFDRIDALSKTGSASKQAYDQLKGQLDVLKENIAFLQENTFVKAGFSGIIAAKNYEDGEMYSPALPILTLTQLQTLKAFVNVPEAYYPAVKTGMKVEIYSEIYPSQTFTATVETVYPTIDPQSHSFQVKLKIPNGKEQLRPGMFVKAKLNLGKDETVLVPYQSILKMQGANNRYVFVNNNGVAKRYEVSLGQRFDERVELVCDSIHVGDQLIVVGQARLVDGKKIEIVQSPTDAQPSF
ncbi:MAG: efflux RND transporter periplasmic adaptor subunit [Bacteroidales bacterium]|jgi:RND family efflux transporter MFP subunit|nr:efflux RND transporter periplasmic adaptor subunit [Bacteroidales bacterium]